jgi:hypothetical protein
VDTPRAFASFASRCGGNGAFGGRHVGESAAETEDRWEERGVSLGSTVDMIVDMLEWILLSQLLRISYTSEDHNSSCPGMLGWSRSDSTKHATLT